MAARFWSNRDMEIIAFIALAALFVGWCINPNFME
jgi:hypothetical protein